MSLNTFRRLSIPSLVILLSFHGISAAQSQEDGFRPLFNGKDLTGWVFVNTPPQTWSVQDGMLLCTGKPIGEIRTDRMYQNFILEVEWRHMVPRGNAGIFVWADDITARGVPFHRGIEVQVLENAYGNTRSHTTHGDIFPIHGAKMVPENGRGGSRAFPTEERSHPSPEWNHYRIECVDGSISLAVNGKVVTRGTDCQPRKGYICIESEGGVVHYRNMKIKELPSSALKDGDVAIADRHLRSLYTGLDLSGWNGGKDEQGSSWKSQDWILRAEAPAGQSTAPLVTDQQFTATRFVTDFRLSNDQCVAELQFRTPAGQVLSAIRSSDSVVAAALQPAGQWNRVEGMLVDGELTVTVNSQTVVHQRSVPTEGRKFHLALNASGGVDFANIFATASE
ncbi:MAG: DUF1080 domain-containing protein [Planctomycetaceae bacterium]|nr:DUF1080 domain-containing protein [Planctomycetaceae bacterium]